MKLVTTSLVTVLLFFSGCTPTRPIAYPISESHSQLTASDYDAAETAFSGGSAPAPDEWAATECQELLDRRDTASAFTLGLTSLAGAGGVVTLIPKDADEDEIKKWDLGVGITSLAFATGATILGALVRSWSARFERECNTKPPLVITPEGAPTTVELIDVYDADGGV